LSSRSSPAGTIRTHGDERFVAGYRIAAWRSNAARQCLAAIAGSSASVPDAISNAAATHAYAARIAATSLSPGWPLRAEQGGGVRGGGHPVGEADHLDLHPVAFQLVQE